MISSNFVVFGRTPDPESIEIGGVFIGVRPENIQTHPANGMQTLQGMIGVVVQTSR
jgi:hypothetical protein